MESFWAIAHPSSVSLIWIAVASQSPVLVGSFNQLGLQKAHVEEGVRTHCAGIMGAKEIWPR